MKDDIRCVVALRPEVADMLDQLAVTEPCSRNELVNTSISIFALIMQARQGQTVGWSTHGGETFRLLIVRGRRRTVPRKPWWRRWL